MKSLIQTFARPSLSRRSQARLCQAGQTTAEYALLTGALALLIATVGTWLVTSGKAAYLLDVVFNHLVGTVT